MNFASIVKKIFEYKPEESYDFSIESKKTNPQFQQIDNSQNVFQNLKKEQNVFNSIKKIKKTSKHYIIP